MSSTTNGSKSLASGVLLVLAGSASYGMLSTFVKLAYRDGYTTAEVTSAQFVWGALVLTLMAAFLTKDSPRATASEKRKLMLAGTSTGFTSVLYYVSVQSISASAAVVLLMQSIWLGVLFECLLKREWPTIDKVIVVVLVLLGTLLATNALDTSNVSLDARGVIFGVLSAVSFTGTLVSTGRIAPHLPSVKRSQFMLYGGALVVLVFALLTQIGPHYLGVQLLGSDFVRDKAVEWRIFATYGLLVAVFGTIIPPLMLNKGFPITGVALGSIISSVELPFATMFAAVLLGERIGLVQAIGVALIIGSVFVLNYRMIQLERAR